LSDAGGASEAVSPRDELAELVASTRALIEWFESAGASDVLVDGTAEAALAPLIPGARAAAPRAPAPPLAFAAPSAAPAPAPARDAVVRPAAPQFVAPQFVAPTFATPSFATPPPPRAPVPAAAAFASAAIPAAPVARPAPPPPPIVAVELDPERAAIAAENAVESDDRRAHLAVLAGEARACTRCVLHVARKQAVFARGNPFAELVFVGEGPGAGEDAQGLPFVGPSGQLLDKMIVAMGYHPDDIYICNIVKCRPPENRKPEPAEMAACSPFVTQQLALIKPKVIVALGATAVQGLLPSVTEGITRMRGKWKIYQQTIPVMPTFHPAYLLRVPDAKRDVWNDLKAVMERLGKPVRKG
jgi:DNA polymerase